MKIVSVLVFALALVWSWVMARTPALVPESVHVDIQNEVKQIITDYVKKHAPESQPVTFDQFWTETLSADKVRARFVYSYADSGQPNAAILHVDGWALLDKVGQAQDTSTWSFDQLHIDDDAIDFQEPIQINVNSTGDTAKKSE